MKIPTLNFKGSKKLGNKYSKDQQSNVLKKWLFDGLPTRTIDSKILGLDAKKSKGFQSMSVLHFFGLKKEFQGIFKEQNISQAIKFFKADVSKFKFKKKYDIIIFLAGIASPFIYKKFPLETLSVCYDGVLNLITKAKNDRSKFVFFSSSEIYGNPDKKNLPTKESYYGNVNSFGPRSCYDEGKRVGETLCYIYNKYYNCDVKIIRPFNVFGPLMDKNDYRIIPNIIKKINSNKKILIHGDGKQTRTFCYITDAITGFLKVILKKNKKLIYNIGNPKNEISMNKLVKSFDKILNKKNKFSLISYPDHYPADEPRRRCPNINLAIKNLNYYPKVSVEEGIKRVLQFNNIIKDT